ncbi:MAG: antibiotic biosynthesis monooxygenase [Alphaproteobacteria bacterium]|nr:antibiotic biosynthesis monooxygenase [Alphaproteobacteria bacterium]
MNDQGPVLRVFEVRTKPGRAGDLLAKFATTSAEVVRGQPGNQGYFFGRVVESDGDAVLFVSVWESLAAIQARFGADWQSSFIPDGYMDLIEECSVRHIDLGGGWHVDAPSQ